MAIAPFPVAQLTKEYAARRRAGQEPTVHAADYPELGGKIVGTIWTRNAAERVAKALIP